MTATAYSNRLVGFKMSERPANGSDILKLLGSLSLPGSMENKAGELEVLIMRWFLTLLFFWMAASHTAGSLRPNLVFLLTDDQRWDAIHCNGNDDIQTPNLDWLAREGVVFDNMFVTTSICAPSRASILTGQYVSRHGITDFQKELSSAQLSKTYLGVLRSAGYQLGFIGKWGVGKPPEGIFHFDRSFAGQGNYTVKVGDEIRHLTSVMGDQAIEFLEGTASDTPFCLSVSFKAAHVQDSYDLGEDPFPFDPRLKKMYENTQVHEPETAHFSFFEKLPRFLQDSENRMRWAVRFWGPQKYQDSVKGYYRLVTGVDLVVGRILESLKRTRLLENTIVIFTSDNGFFLGEFGLAGKWLPHEVSIRVPLVIFNPHLADSERNQRRGEMALNLDLAPTLLDLAGLEVPDEMQGKSLAPLLADQATSWRTEFFYEHHYRHPRIPRTEAVRTREWKYIRYLDSDPLFEELYHLSNDPKEKDNLTVQPGHASRLAKMREDWKRLQQLAR